MKKIILVILITILFNQVYSQDTSIVKYFPLKIGNVWVYSGYGWGTGCSLTIIRRVLIKGSVILNSKKYFVVQDTTKIISGMECGPCGSCAFDTVRVDSMNGDIYKYSISGCIFSPYEKMIDSLKAHFHDTVKINCGLTPGDLYICNDTNPKTIFSQMLPSRTYSEVTVNGGIFRTFIKGIGQSHYGCGVEWGTFNATLVGCVLDGILYGDTSFYTGIKPISNQLPESFSLYQNYPNPFNPTTKIKFDIPLLRGVPEGRGVFTNIKIYDILGRDVATLVNERLHPGTYEIEWDASNFASGIYFYRLVAGDFTMTKKMALVK